MTADLTLPFGKHRNRTAAEIFEADPGYLEWVLGTDIPERFPAFAEAARLALTQEPETPDAVSVEPTDAPGVGYTVRGGGAMRDGTLWIALLTLDGVTNYERHYMADSTEGLSRSGASGSVSIEEPTEDGVYEVAECSGSIRNHTETRVFLLRHMGRWYEIGSKANAVAILRGAIPVCDETPLEATTNEEPAPASLTTSELEMMIHARCTERGVYLHRWQSTLNSRGRTRVRYGLHSEAEKPYRSDKADGGIIEEYVYDDYRNAEVEERAALRSILAMLEG